MKMEYYNNTLCIEAGWLVATGIITKANYDQQVARGFIKVLRRACKGTPALVEYNSLPTRFQELVIENNNNIDPTETTPLNHFIEYILHDSKAKEYFSTFELPDGRTLPNENQNEYYNNAIVLNAIHTLFTDRKKMRKALGNKTNGSWVGITNIVKSLDKRRYPHTLPSSERRLHERYNKYVNEGYFYLIHKGFCHSNSRKVTDDLERLILSIYTATNNPYASWVHEDYLKFIAGTIEIIDMQTGEIFNRDNFYDEKTGAPIMISEATCWNYINNPKNRAIVDEIRMTPHKYHGTIRPHNHRIAARKSLNKISMDDRDLPRRLHNGNRVKAYYAYDVASGCLIGASYSVRKDTGLFIDCMRDMFRFIDKHGWGMPMEVEVEHHLVSNFKDDLMKAGVVFPFVRWCAPTNSQEKHAENFNRVKKYGFEKRYQSGGIGRFYAKLEANQTGGERVFDEIQQKYVIKEQTYDYNNLVADDLKSIERYNNALHSNQKLYKGKTRLQVLVENINPDLAVINRAVLARYIGEVTKTSVTRNMYCSVQYAKYMLPTPEILKQLEPNNYTVNAYYIPNETGIIDEVYIYQNDQFISKCSKIDDYSTATVERTDADLKAKQKQDKYIAQYDVMIKRGKTNLASTKIIENDFDYSAVEPEIVQVKKVMKNNATMNNNYDDDEYQTAHALNSL